LAACPVAREPGEDFLTGCERCGVRHLSVCAAVQAGDLGLLEGLSRQMDFRAQEVIASQGQYAHSVFNVVAGTVRLYKLLPDRRRQIVGFAVPGDFIGLAMREDFRFSAEAVNDVSICALPRAAFATLVETRLPLLSRVQDFTAHEVLMAQDHILLLGRRGAEEKVVCFLLGLRARWAEAGRFSVTVPLPMSRQDIADYLGLTIETVSRTFTRLAREKAILTVPDGVRLLDIDRLFRIAAG
jgi:CRP/FNR family transcriptional regulator